MINYEGEHALIGQIGYFLVLLGFVSAILSAVSYSIATKNPEPRPLLKIGRISFIIHAVSVLGIIGSLFFMLINQYFEYDYVWKHSNTSMPMHYVFSAFWEGQEGSFLLWMFWHVILGLILLKKAKTWEAPVIAVFSIVQVFLVSMLLGIYFGDHKIGSNPFLLIRELPENYGLPWTFLPDYLTRIPEFADGRGLNPLLQNYWMTIHPPTLFLGFASVLVPFAYALGGMWTGKIREWINPALPWTYFSIAALGLGILMGGAWAYEALSFGGFWAWDPVENSSLVPWIFIVGAGHLMLVNRQKNRSLFLTIFLTLSAFILVLYSTFLTRSGVLGDTSVHSFTGDGMIGQLLVYLLFFIALATGLMIFDRKLRRGYFLSVLILLLLGIFSPMKAATVVVFLIFSAIVLIITYQKHFPKPAEEENLWSREFWVFIGSLVLLLSAVQITFETSKPVWNLMAEPFSGVFGWLYDTTSISGFKALAEGKLAPHSDVIQHYNKWQIPFAVIVSLLIAVGQFFRYKNTDMKVFLKKMTMSFAIALFFSVVLYFSLKFNEEHFSLAVLLFATIFAFVANFDYLFRVLKGKFDQSGPSIAHMGFALLILGALISTGKSVKISQNSTGMDIERLSEDFNNNEDILLFKGDTVLMNNYFVTYQEREQRGGDIFFKVQYFDRAPNTYKKGDLIFSQGGVYRAVKDHEPGESFLKDQENWEFVMEPGEEEIKKMKIWSRYRPGNYLFELEPFLQLNPTFGNVPEPDTRHYLDRDIYTHIRWAEVEKEDIDEEGFMPMETHVIQVGDTLEQGPYAFRLDSVVVVGDLEKKEKFSLFETDLAVKAIVKIRDNFGEIHRAEPLFILRDDLVVPDVADVPEPGVRMMFSNIDPRNGTFELQIAIKPEDKREFIVMQAILFPMINILWVGCLLMIIGTLMAVRFRIKANKR